MNKKVYLIRHAEGYHNLNENYNIFDPQLTANGYQQILEKKKRIRKY